MPGLVLAILKNYILVQNHFPETLTRIDELNVTGDGVFADAGLEPWLTQFVASHVNRHPGFEIVHATENEIQRSVRQAARADAVDEVIVILDGGDVVVERLDCHVRVDSLK